MNSDHPLPSSWEIMFAIRETLGAVELQKIFSRGQTQLNRYCMAPHFADAQRNPLDRLQVLTEQLEAAGEHELALAAINFILEPLTARATAQNLPTPDKDTLEEECLDDFPELTTLDALIAKQSHPRDVIQQAERVKNEVDETIVKYLEHWNKHNPPLMFPPKA